MGISLRWLSTLAVTAAATVLFTFSSSATGTILVTNGEDGGEGSLRAALEAAAKEETPGQILVITDRDIEINSTLVYSGKAPLSIHGRGQTVKTKVDTTLLALSEGADLTVSDLNFEGPGNFDVKNRGEASKGIFVDVRPDQTGVVTLVLHDVRVSGVRLALGGIEAASRSGFPHYSFAIPIEMGTLRMSSRTCVTARRGQDGQNKAEQCQHCALTSGDPFS